MVPATHCNWVPSISVHVRVAISTSASYVMWCRPLMLCCVGHSCYVVSVTHVMWYRPLIIVCTGMDMRGRWPHTNSQSTDPERWPSRGITHLPLQVQDVSQCRHKKQEARQEAIRNKGIAPGYKMRGLYGSPRTRLLILLLTSGASSQRCCDETRRE